MQCILNWYFQQNQCLNIKKHAVHHKHRLVWGPNARGATGKLPSVPMRYDDTVYGNISPNSGWYCNTSIKLYIISLCFYQTNTMITFLFRVDCVCNTSLILFRYNANFRIVVTSGNLLFNNIPWIIIFCKNFPWTVIVWLPNLPVISVPDDGYSRNTSCAFNLISTFFYFSTYTNPTESAHGHFVYLPNKHSQRQAKACKCLNQSRFDLMLNTS